MKTADRLKEVQEYYFSKKLREIRDMKEAGHDVINLAIGSPDLPPPLAVTEKLKAATTDAGANQYQSYQGTPQLRKAIADFTLQHYGETLNPEEEILPLMGSKEGITHIALAYLNKGDQVLIPELGYPTYTSVTKMVEAEPVYYPMSEDNNWEPQWAYFDKLDYSRVKIIFLNYPHMPTGTRGDAAIFRHFVAIAQKHDVLLVHDNPYSFILNDEPRSIFSTPGAFDVALELNSLSKSFNMSGWRVGWVSGSKEKISNVLRIKSNMDSGMYYPIQMAAVEALCQPKRWFDEINHIYSTRRQKAYSVLDALACDYNDLQTGMFVWAKTPPGQHADQLVNQLLRTKHVFVTPGHIFGERGKDFIRISLCASEDVFEQALKRIES